MKNIFINNKSFVIPSKWNELTKKQLLYIAFLLSQKFTKEEIVVLLTMFFSKYGVRKISKIEPLIFKELEKHYNFIFDIKLTVNLLPKIFIRFKRFYGPTKALSNMTFEQFFVFSESYFDNFTKTGSQYSLDLLIASLYTRQQYKFEPLEVEQNAKVLKHLSLKEKYAILIFYQGNRNFLAKQFNKLFSSGDTDSKKEYDFLGLVELLNNKDVSKNNQIKNTNIYEIFTYLTNLKSK